MKITDDMVYELNETLEYKGYSFRYEYNDSILNGNSCMKITLPRMKGVDSFIINPTKEFFEWLEGWFMQYGIELSCNNDGSIIWSKNGWND